MLHKRFWSCRMNATLVAALLTACAVNVACLSNYFLAGRSERNVSAVAALELDFAALEPRYNRGHGDDGLSSHH
jgi:hypothetical protein